ncbi:MAG: T9SS type A sorting domain-containing protein [Chitinophagales bacterium]
MSGFWGGGLLAGGSPYDPRVEYDPYTRRWIIISVSVNSSFQASRILVAVSQTGNPTGTWYKFSVVTDATNATWLDFPCLGFNKQWITVTGNYFTTAGSSTNSVIYAFNKTLLLAGTSATATRIVPSGFTVCPAVTYDSLVSSMFLVDAYSSNKLRLRKLTGTASAAVLSGTLGYPTSATTWAYQGGGGADFAPQLGSTHKLQTNDDRVNNVTFRNGKVWCAHNVFLPSSSPNRCSAMWWQIDTVAGAVNQNGLIDDPTAAIFYAFPTITANKNNDALIGFSYLSASVHPSCGYALHMSGDVASTMRPVYVYRHGLTAYYQIFSGTQNRWGDYSGTCVDPRNDRDFWTIQETTNTSTNIWDTWWAFVTVCPTRPMPTLVISPTSQCIGDSALFAVTSDTGASSFTWTLSTSTGWSTFGSTTDSIYLTSGTGVATVTVTANNGCGQGPALTFTVTPTLIPPLPVINTLTPVCLGTPPTAIFSASPRSAYTTYNWQVYGTGWGGISVTDSFTATVGIDTGTVIVSETNACGTGPNDTIRVMPGTVPSADTAITSPALLCSGRTAVFSTPAVPGATSYTWSVSGTGWSGSSTTSSVTTTIGTSTGSMTVTPVNSCGTGTPFVLSGIAPVITPTGSFTESTHTVTAYTNITITTPSEPTGTTYTWNFNGGIATPGTGAGPQSVKWNAAGTYTVTLTVNNGGCTATFSDTVHVTFGVGVGEVNTNEIDATIVPNPNDGSFDILFNEVVNNKISVKIVDMQGRVVYTKEFSKTQNNKLSIAINDLVTGIYVATIYMDDTVITKKITINK